MQHVYSNIKALRRAAKITQDELAQLTGYTDRSSISLIESGEIDLPLSKVSLFAKALHTTPAALLGLEPTSTGRGGDKGTSSPQDNKTRTEYQMGPLPEDTSTQAHISAFGKRIREHREALHMSQRDLAKHMGYSHHSTLARIELGEVDPPLSRILQFASVFQVSLVDLLDWEQEQAPDGGELFCKRKTLIAKVNHLSDRDCAKLLKILEAIEM